MTAPESNGSSFLKHYASDDHKIHAAGSDVIRLRGLGLQVRLDDTAFHMHHKFALSDGTRLDSGSFNWTRGASTGSEENLVVTDDMRLVRSFGPGSSSCGESPQLLRAKTRQNRECAALRGVKSQGRPYPWRPLWGTDQRLPSPPATQPFFADITHDRSQLSRLPLHPQTHRSAPRHRDVVSR